MKTDCSRRVLRTVGFKYRRVQSDKSVNCDVCECDMSEMWCVCVSANVRWVNVG